MHRPADSMAARVTHSGSFRSRCRVCARVVASTRMFALEFILSMCECAPEMLRKHMPLIESVMRIAADFACHMADDPEWCTKDDDLNNLQTFGDVDTDVGTAMCALGDEALDRIAAAIGGRLIVRDAAKCAAFGECKSGVVGCVLGCALMVGGCLLCACAWSRIPRNEVTLTLYRGILVCVGPRRGWHCIGDVSKPGLAPSSRRLHRHCAGGGRLRGPYAEQLCQGC